MLWRRYSGEPDNGVPIMMQCPIYAFEPLDRLLSDGARDLVCKHWKEIGRFQDKAPLDIDWQAHLNEERSGRLRVFTARLDDEILGYIMFRFFKPDRYRSTQFIVGDVFWFTPEDRGKGWGYRMFHEAQAALPRPFVGQWRRKIGLDDDKIDRILRSLGLEPMEIVYWGWFE